MTKPLFVLLVAGGLVVFLCGANVGAWLALRTMQHAVDDTYVDGGTMHMADDGPEPELGDDIIASGMSHLKGLVNRAVDREVQRLVETLEELGEEQPELVFSIYPVLHVRAKSCVNILDEWGRVERLELEMADGTRRVLVQFEWDDEPPTCAVPTISFQCGVYHFDGSSCLRCDDCGEWVNSEDAVHKHHDRTYFGDLDVGGDLVINGDPGVDVDR